MKPTIGKIVVYKPGTEFPMVITRVHQDGTVNGHVFVDGGASLWVCCASEGPDIGNWHWPERQPERKDSPQVILKDLQEIRKQADACRASDEDERVNRIMAACDRIEAHVKAL